MVPRSITYRIIRRFNRQSLKVIDRDVLDGLHHAPPEPFPDMKDIEVGSPVLPICNALDRRESSGREKALSNTSKRARCTSSSRSRDVTISTRSMLIGPPRRHQSAMTTPCLAYLSENACRAHEVLGTASVQLVPIVLARVINRLAISRTSLTHKVRLPFRHWPELRQPRIGRLRVYSCNAWLLLRRRTFGSIQ